MSDSQALKIVVTRQLPSTLLAPFASNPKRYELIVWPSEEKPCSQEWLFENVKGASGILCMITEKVTAELLDIAGPSLRAVSTMSVGFEHADLSALASRKIRFGYTPDVLTDAVADITVMLALMASRNIREDMRLVDDGKWPSLAWSPFALCGQQISLSPLLTKSLPSQADAGSNSGTPPTIGTLNFKPKRVAGFLGFGRISRATLARLIPFGITDVIYTGNPKSPPETGESKYRSEFPSLNSISSVSLSTLFSDSDVLFLLAPSNADTYHIASRALLRSMKPTAVLVNTARGTLIDSEVLAEALREGWIWGAGLDVVEGEPKVGKDHVLVKEPRCVILPHIGSSTMETRMGMASLAVTNVHAGVDGREMGAELDLSRYR